MGYVKGNSQDFGVANAWSEATFELGRDKKNKGLIIAYSFTGGAHEEVTRVRSELDIKLIEAKKLATSFIDGDKLFEE